MGWKFLQQRWPWWPWPLSYDFYLLTHLRYDEICFNLNNRSWGLFRPRRNITRHYFLIGWTYSFVFHNMLRKDPRRCDGVRYDPKTYVGVKKDPRTCLTWLFFGPVLRVKIAPSVDKGRILIRILITVSICKGLGRIFMWMPPSVYSISTSLWFPEEEVDGRNTLYFFLTPGDNRLIHRLNSRRKYDWF